MPEVGLISTSITSVALLIIGTLVAFATLRTNRPHVPGANYFILLCLCLSIWLTANVLSDIDTARSLLWVRISFGSIAVGLTCLLLFVSMFPVKRHAGKVEVIFQMTLLIVVMTLIASPLIIPRVVFESGVSTVVPGSMYWVFIVFVIYTLAHSMIRLLRRRRLAKRYRLQTKPILIGVLITSVVAFTTNLLLPLLVGNNDLYWVASISSLAFVGGTAYAIARQGLFDITFAVVRTLTYTLSLFTLGGIYAIIAYVASLTLFEDESARGVTISPINIVLVLALAFTFQPIKGFFDKVTDKVFFRNRYNAGEFYSRMSEILASNRDLRGLLQRAGTELGMTLKAEYACFIIHLSDEKKVVVSDKGKRSFPDEDLADLDRYVKRHGDAVIVTDLLPRGGHLRRLLVSHEAALCMPLIGNGEMPEYLVLGYHKGSGFTGRDIEVLKTITDELIIAIRNARSVQQIKDINASLEQRISAATGELRTSNARLKRLDAAKDEFISMASHQLRTPLTSVKGYLSMVLEGDVGKVTKMQRQVLEEAYSSSERMVHLIHDFLNVSRLQTGKFVLELQEVDISRLIAEEVKSLERTASSRRLKLHLDDTVGSLMMTVDDTKIRQVVMNYIDNAIFYSHPDTTISISFAKEGSEVVFTVKDTGIGVPKKEQAQLFEKFFRASNARKERPDGTGVGIFLAKKIIDAHGGEVIFSSKEGRGSTFGFRLPNPTGLDKDANQLDK